MFIDKHLGVRFEQYADLDAEVLGVTEFVAGDRPRIRINQDLTGSALDEDETPLGVLGRWRATLAHEASHVLLHRRLFERDRNQLSLFGDDEPRGGATQVFQSLKRDVTFSGRGGDWREVQANKGMAALLMPRRLFIQVCEHEIGSKPFSSPPVQPDDPEVFALVTSLSKLFLVSRQAASIRLETLDILGRYKRPGLLI
ncbi:MAG: ImmA/IrrE family metallo-endopeptidase [Isosphaeraceae bacterium]